MKACRGCRALEDLRGGYCFDCASRGEERAAHRSVGQHLMKALFNLAQGSSNYKYDLKWAWGRLTSSGDYAPKGYFDSQGYL